MTSMEWTVAEWASKGWEVRYVSPERSVLGNNPAQFPAWAHVLLFLITCGLWIVFLVPIELLRAKPETVTLLKMPDGSIEVSRS